MASEFSSGISSIYRLDKAQDVFDRCYGLNSHIFGRDCEDSDASKGQFGISSTANDHTVSVRSWQWLLMAHSLPMDMRTHSGPPNSLIFRIDSDAIASRRGRSRKQSGDNDQAGSARCCGRKYCRVLSDGAAIAARKGASAISRGAIAHGVVTRSCGEH